MRIINDMNRLSTAKRAKILRLLCASVSMREIADVEGVSINTVVKLLHVAGLACGLHHLQYVHGIPGVRHVQCDELWSFVYAKDRSLAWADPWDKAGTVWTFTALDAETKLLISYMVRKKRSTKSAVALFKDLRGRLVEPPMLTTDSLAAYAKASVKVFGKDANLSQVRKGEESDHNTSFVERHNLTIRMSNRRYSRRTNAFSKKMSKHQLMMHLFGTYYNYCRIHKTLKVTPAMAAGLTDTLYDCEWIVGLIEEITPKPKKPGRKKRK